METVGLPIDGADYRRAVGVFASGVAIVTTWDETRSPSGMTATSLTAVSNDPASILICIKRDSRTHNLVVSNQSFAVNLLPAELVEPANYCAHNGGNKVLPSDWLTLDETFSSPVIAGALATLDCRIADVFTSGTHSIIVGELTRMGLASHRRALDPLVHYRGAFWHLANPAQRRPVAPLPIMAPDALY